MLDLDLDQQLRDEFRSAADGAQPSERLDGLVRQRIVQRQRQRRLMAGGGAALAVALVAGVTAALVGDRGNDAVVADAGGGLENVVYLVPEDVPEGMELVFADGGDTPEAALPPVQVSDWDWTQRWFRTDDMTTAVDAQLTEVTDSAAGRLDQLAADHAAGGTGGDGAVEVIVDGATGYYAEATGELLWPVGSEHVGRVAAIGNHVPLADLKAFAEKLVPTDTGSFGIEPGPGGFELGGEWPALASPGTNARTLVYKAADGRGFALQVVDDTEIPTALSALRGVGHEGTLSYLEQLGGAGLVARDLVDRPVVGGAEAEFVANADTFVQWEDPHGSRVTLGGIGLTEQELLGIADSLGRVDRQTWFDLQGGSDLEVAVEPEVTAPPITPPVDPNLTTTLLPPVQLPGLPGTEVLNAVFRGTETYSLTTDANCKAKFVYDAAFTLPDGGTWQYHADYCANLTSSSWKPVSSTVGIMTPDGSTLVGTMDAKAIAIDDLSLSDPVGVTITGGTGAYAGATGTCTFDTHVIGGALVPTQQSGNVSCSLNR
jgi:hypothetical protein